MAAQGTPPSVVDVDHLPASWSSKPFIAVAQSTRPRRPHFVCALARQLKTRGGMPIVRWMIQEGMLFTFNGHWAFEDSHGTHTSSRPPVLRSQSVVEKYLNHHACRCVESDDKRSLWCEWGDIPMFTPQFGLTTSQPVCCHRIWACPSSFEIKDIENFDVSSLRR